MLKTGSSGDEVKQLQEDLALLGFDPGPIDGAFGPKTAEAVRAFQESVASLDVDGVAGPKTAASLAARVGPKRMAQKLTGDAEDEAESADTGGGSTPM